MRLLLLLAVAIAVSLPGLLWQLPYPADRAHPVSGPSARLLPGSPAPLHPTPSCCMPGSCSTASANQAGCGGVLAAWRGCGR